MAEDDTNLEGKGMKNSKQLNVNAALYVDPNPSSSSP